MLMISKAFNKSRRATGVPEPLGRRTSHIIVQYQDGPEKLDLTIKILVVLIILVMVIFVAFQFSKS